MSEQNFLKKIASNIEKFNFHVTAVQSGRSPRFAYTIGALEKLDFELIFAGGVNFLSQDLLLIFNTIIPSLNKKVSLDEFVAVIPGLGSFTLSKIHKSWSELMMLGVYDYYNVDNFQAYQIIPESQYNSLDIPDMSREWSSDNVIWKWLDDSIEWNLAIPEDSIVATELNVLLGEKVTEVARWEDGDWEAFTQNGDDVDQEDVRVIPIMTLLGIDPSAHSILELKVGDGIWREDGDSEWQEWL